ncbi:MAG: 3-phosphoshikimate 1-carboxyvinyltransferase [Clostridia bacterium]|nr:3-phosphoshikimate 1-carboxyvinyltransferase [Clostridia bacterium]
MILEITPSPLCGEVNAINSKSELHRVLICAALADAPCRLTLGNPTDSLSNDVKATIDCLRALGAGIDVDSSEVFVTPIKEVADHPVLDCKESGSTLRFLMPVATALCGKVTFKGNDRLTERPIGSLKNALESHGVSFSSDTLPFTATGRLQPGIFEVTGDLSSQYVSGLLLALPLFEEKSSIKLTTPLLSHGYVELTIKALADFGIATVSPKEGLFSIVKKGDGLISPGSLTIEGDWSNAAFFYVANFLGNDVTINNLRFNSLQRDKSILDFLSLYTAEIEGENIRGVKSYEIDLVNTPDLLPALSVAAAFADGMTTFTGAARLRLKESDRLTSVCAMINSLGGRAEDTADGIIIWPKPLTGGTVESFGDHRIVMAATIASTRCTQPVIINEARAVDKSYPSFFRDIENLGGKISVI